jgi:2,5-diketo-D-gluconate reductase A
VNTETPVIPSVALADGTTIPQLGFGTYLIPPATTAEAVTRALEAGYRHIDTAQMYDNERGVGEAIATSGLPRGDLYITTKLNNNMHAPADVRRSFETSLDRLGLDYLDLFLMHWPLPTRFNGTYPSTWEAMAALLDDRLVRSVGVSNFEPHHLERIIHETGVTPTINQIEAHPYFPNDTARAASAAHDVAVEAWGPLGQGAVLDDPVVIALAEELGKSPAQVVLRWHIERGDIVFPKSTNPDRMRENLDILDFSLPAHGSAEVSNLDRGDAGRVGAHPDHFAYVPS